MRRLRVALAMSDLPISPRKRSTPVATGVLAVVAFAAVCGIAAGHTIYSGIFPFVVLAMSLTFLASFGNSAER